MQEWDVGILLWLNGWAGYHYGFDLFVVVLTQGAPLVFALMFGWCFLRAGQQPDEMRRTVLLSGLSGVLAVALSFLLDALIYRMRPFGVLPPPQIYALVPQSMDSSFPSDHTIGSAAFAAGMWRSSARLPFAVMAFLVGVSRLVAGVHWPSDVAGSTVLGAAVALGVFALERPLRPVLDWIVHQTASGGG